MSRTHPLHLMAAALLAVAAAPDLSAQTPEAAALAVTVRSSATSAPLPGARVTVRNTSFAATTDAAGRARFAGLAPGAYTVDVRAEGYLAGRLSAELTAGAAVSLSIEMDLGMVTLPGVAGEAQRTAGGQMLQNAGFFDRQRSTTGTFLTRADLDRMQPRQLSDVLRRYANVKLEYDRFQRGRLGTRRQTGSTSLCRATIYVNNMTSPGMEIDDVNPEDIEGLEIYSGATESPPEYRWASHCGLVVIWTRVS